MSALAFGQVGLQGFRELVETIVISKADSVEKENSLSFLRGDAG